MAKASQESSTSSRRPIPDLGDSNSSVTYEAVGRALSTWEILEFTLSRLYAEYVTSDQDVPALRAYGVIESFAARLSMVRAAGHSFYFTAHRSYWGCRVDFGKDQSELDALHNKLKAFGERRNEIAHGVVIHNPFRPPGVDEHFGKQPLYSSLQPSYCTTKRRGDFGQVQYAYSSRDINFYTEQFEAQKTCVFDIIIKVRDIKNNIKKSDVERKKRGAGDADVSIHPTTSIDTQSKVD